MNYDCLCRTWVVNVAELVSAFREHAHCDVAVCHDATLGLLTPRRPSVSVEELLVAWACLLFYVAYAVAPASSSKAGRRLLPHRDESCR